MTQIDSLGVGEFAVTLSNPDCPYREFSLDCTSFDQDRDGHGLIADALSTYNNLRILDIHPHSSLIRKFVCQMLNRIKRNLKQSRVLERLGVFPKKNQTRVVIHGQVMKSVKFFINELSKTTTE